MNNVNSKTKSLSSIISILLILISFALGVFYLKPTWDSSNQLSLSLNEKNDYRSQLNSKLVSLQELQQELQLSSEVSQVMTLSSIPEKLLQDQLIIDLSKIAKDNDMNMNGISFDIPTSSVAGNVSKVNLSTSITGNYSSLISYLRDIEGNSRKFTVKNISVQVGETDTGISRVNFNINMEAYFQGII